MQGISWRDGERTRGLSTKLSLVAEPPGVEGTPRQKLYGLRGRPRAEAWGNTRIQQASRGTGARREAAKGSLERWEEAEGERGQKPS